MRAISEDGAGGGIRTRTRCEPRQILSLVRLPFRHPGMVCVGAVWAAANNEPPSIILPFRNFKLKISQDIHGSASRRSPDFPPVSKNAR